MKAMQRRVLLSMFFGLTVPRVAFARVLGVAMET